MTAILSYIIFSVIVIGIFVAIGLTIYRKILEIKKIKNEKKSLEKESIK
jgi:hypothetical protein